MKAVWVDATNGAAGDMLLAALLDAGASLDMVRSGLSRLRVEPVGVAVSQVRRHGFRATLVSVDAPEVATHRGLRAIADLIGAAAFPDLVWRFALDTFTRLAEAEARVHGIPVDDVHFHEVGALDAIADVVGCALALHDLGLLDAATRVVSPVAVGSGVTAAVHGRLPIPAPAVLELLARAGAPIAAHPAAMELCTPTGAALLATLATGWGPPPPLTARAAGSGAGTKDAESHPNLLRVLIGDAEAAGAEWSVAEFFEVQATIDDLDPRVWPDLLAALRTAGAADAWCTPALMRKGRPGQVLTVLVDGDLLDHACRVVFTQTTTLGLRVRAVQRRALRRDEVTVTVAGASVGVKRGFLGDRLVTAQPEYDDARAAAAQSGLSITEVIASARQAATQDRHNSG